MKSASINAVYSLVKDICNANNRGYVSPSQYNQFAIQAQQELFGELLSSMDTELSKRKRGVAYSTGSYDSIEQIQDTLRPLLRFQETLSNVSDNVFSIPVAYSYVLSVEVDGVSADIIPPDKATFAVNSFLAAPQKSAPVCVIDGSQITMYPSTLTVADNITITYYKYPQGTVPSTGAASTSNPTWGYSTINNVAVYNPTVSIDFELPKAMEYRLAIKVLAYLGVNMREQEIVQFANMQEQMEAAKGN